MLPRLRTLWRRRSLERELDEELRDHLERQTELLVSRGMSVTEARRQARLDFGGLEQAKEECRDARGLTLIDGVVQDLRYGTRVITHHPGFAAVAVLSLALGIGANTAVFSVMDAALFKPLPVTQPDELVMFAAVSPAGGWYSNVEAEIWDEIRRAPRSFSAVCASWMVPTTVRTSADDAERVSLLMVTGGYYRTLGVPAYLGRTISPEDERNAAHGLVAVLSHSYWARRFGRDPAIIGRTLFVRGAPAIVVGVTPPGFFGLDRGRPPDLTIPLQRSEGNDVWIVGRLAPGVPRTAALTEADSAMRRALEILRPQLARWSPRDRDRRLSLRAGLLPLEEAAAEGTLGRRKQMLRVLIVLSAIILLISCANVSNLLLARSAARAGEISLRLAIGADRRRIVRQLLTESALLAAAGAVLGVGAAFWAGRALVVLLMGEGPAVAVDVPIDHRVLAFSALVATAAVLLFGLAPALRATRIDLRAASSRGLAAGPGLHLGAQRALLIVQVAAALVLVVGAGLLARTLANLRFVDPGFDSHSVLLMNLDTTARSTDPPTLARLHQTVLEHVGDLPGVESAALAMNVLFGNGGWSKTVWAEGPSSEGSAQARFNVVSAGYFRTAGLSVVLGREFTSRDRLGGPLVAIVNRAFVRRVWPGVANPLGLRFGDEGAGSTRKYEVVGVVEDAKIGSLRERPGPTVYQNLLQSESVHPQGVTLHLRTKGDPARLVPSVRAALRAVDRELFVHSARTLEAAVSETLRQERLMAALSSFFGLLALALTSIGVYGVVSYTVERRTHEIGIRVALGAGRERVMWTVMQATLMAVLSGIAVGVPAALALARMLKALLFGLEPADTTNVLVAVAVVLAAGALAGYVPARRAVRLDPMVALRQD